MSQNPNFFRNPSNLLKISPDIRDIFKNLSLKSEYPLNRGSLNRGFLTLEKPEKIRDQTVLSLKCGYPLNRGATKVGFHGIVFESVEHWCLDHNRPKTGQKWAIMAKICISANQFIIKQIFSSSLTFFGLFVENKARYTATPVACRWVGAVIEVTKSFGQEQWRQKPQKKK